MKLLKLTAYSLAIASAIFLESCEPDAEQDRTTDFEKKGIIMSGAQENPAVPSTALGKLDVFYTKDTRTLTYSFNWSGLTDSVTGIHIHGLAPVGYNAGIVQNIVAATNTIFPQKTSGKYTYLRSGSLSGTLQVDGVVIKEEDLINGMYYLNIHSLAYPGGEIRGQIRFQ